MITISTRLDEKIVKEIERTAAEMNLDRGVLIRKYILDGHQRMVMKHNLELVKTGEISIGQAANNADVSIYQILEFARSLDLQIGADETTLPYELKVLEKRMGQKSGN